MHPLLEVNSSELWIRIEVARKHMTVVQEWPLEKGNICIKYMRPYIILNINRLLLSVL